MPPRQQTATASSSFWTAVEGQNGEPGGGDRRGAVLYRRRCAITYGKKDGKKKVPKPKGRRGKEREEGERKFI